MPSKEQRPTHFKTLQKLHPDYATVDVTQYESGRTGMRVVVVDQKGPKVYGYFALATEIHDDSGSPHTLEHLCFMGSKSYRYKGVLDKIATRAYSTTNAWTAVEHTAYTLESAGWEGFAQILPIYLEHVIVPTLNDAACLTEVHHIDGTGHDAGVVYSEMQGVQNNSDELMELQARRLIYPEGSGFRYETGGMMEQLRVLTADRIRDFHKEMYQPKNLCLVLIGEIDHENMLQILDDFEGGILEDVPSPDAPFKRPWVESEPTPSLTRTIVDTVKFPEEDESMGEILIGFLGPDCNDHIQGAALGILLIYLCGSSVSVLENTLIEKEQLASMIYYSTDTRPDIAIWFSLAAVESDKLAFVENRFFEVLKETARKELDMAYMGDCMSRFRRQIKFQCESSIAFFATPIIEDHLFGHRDGRDLRDMQTLDDLDNLSKWSDQQWRDLLSKWLADAHHVSVLGQPSKEMSDKLKSDEQSRVKAQKERLGEAGLKKLAQQLEEAKAKNDKRIPDSMIESFPVPGTSSIHFISTTTARAGSARKMGKIDNGIQKILDKDDSDSPLFIHFEHIPSNFVRVKLVMCTGTIPVELKPLLSLYLQNFFTTPVKLEGKRVEFEEVVTKLEQDTIGYDLNSGPGNVELLSITFQVEPDKYESAIQWLRTMMFDTIHDQERLHSALTKMIADIPDEKRSGNGMCYSVASMIQYEQTSSIRARDTLVKAVYLRRIRRQLQDEPEAVISQLSKLSAALHRFENFRVFVAGNIEKLRNPVSSWKILTAGLDNSTPLSPLDDRKSQLSKIGRNPGKVFYVTPMATIDSSFGLFTGKGPDHYEHPDLPALLVALSYMDAVEGPLWVAVRGTGLAYGTGFSRTVETGKLQFRIYRSPNAFEAYKAAREQVGGYASGKLPLEKLALEGAISSIVLGIADEQPTMGDAASLSFVNQVIRGISKDWSTQMLAKVRNVTPEQIRDVMSRVVLPVFEPDTTNAVVTCAQIMEQDLVEKFTQAGFKPEVKPLEFFQDDYGLKPKDGEDELDEEDEEDDDQFEDGADTPASEENE